MVSLKRMFHKVLRLLLRFMERRSTDKFNNKMPKQVQAACQAIEDALGSSFSRDDLILLIEKVIRNKPLVVRTMKLPSSITGFCLTLQDCDLICVQENLNDILLLTSVLHECGHLILGHIRSKSSDMPTLDVFTCNPYYYLQEALFRTTMDMSVLDDEAETFARALFPRIYHHEQASSPAARNLFDE